MTKTQHMKRYETYLFLYEANELNLLSFTAEYQTAKSCKFCAVGLLMNGAELALIQERGSNQESIDSINKPIRDRLSGRCGLSMNELANLQERHDGIMGQPSSKPKFRKYLKTQLELWHPSHWV